MKADNPRNGSARPSKSASSAMARRCSSVRLLAGCRQPQQRRVSGFVQRHIGALGLAQGLGVCLHVEDVVAHLEGEAGYKRRRRRAAPAARCWCWHRTERPGEHWRGIRAPVLWRCMFSSSWRLGWVSTAARSMAWPPAMPREPLAWARVAIMSMPRRAWEAPSDSTWKAALCNASPASNAFASPKAR